MRTPAYYFACYAVLVLIGVMLASVFVTVDGVPLAQTYAQATRPSSLRVEMYNEQSQRVSFLNIPIPRDRFKRYFRAFDVAQALGIQEAHFAEPIIVMDGFIPRSVRVFVNYFDDSAPAMWFEFDAENANRFFSEPVTENDARLK